MEHMFYNHLTIRHEFGSGQLVTRKEIDYVTAEEMFDKLTAENKEIVIRQIEILVASQSENQSPLYSLH